MGSAEVEARVLAGDDIEWPAGSQLDDGRQGDAAEDVFGKTIATLRRRALEDGAGDPPVALVVHGVRALEKWETGILGLERRLQVGGIVNRVRIGVAGKQLERVREALGEIKGQGVVPGVAVGELSVDAVEGNRYTKTSREAGGLREGNLRGIATGNQGGEGGVGAGRPEEIEEGRRGDEADRRATAILPSVAQAENSGREGLTCWSCKGYASARGYVERGYTAGTGPVK